MSHKLLAGSIKPHELGFDFDGVIADTAESFLRIACVEYGLCDLHLEDITHFDLEHCLALDSRITTAIFTKILEDSVAIGLQALPGAVEVLCNLATRQDKINVITARSLRDPVVDWFATVLPPWAVPAIHVIAMGNHDEKLDHIRGQGLRYFIDDRPETCMQLENAGIQPIVFQQPWNREACSGLPLVKSWEDIKDILDWSR